MNKTIKNLTIGLGILTAPALANATSFSFNDFSDTSELSLYGAATNLNPNNDGVLRLTNQLFQASSTYYNQTLPLENNFHFSTSFSFQMSNPGGISDSDGQGADGLAFIFNGSDKLLGGLGGALGYSGISNSLVIEFDSWNNGAIDKNNGNHVGVNINGNLTSVAQTNVAQRFNDGDIWYTWIDYSPINDLLAVRLSNDGVRPEDALLSYTIDMQSIVGDEFLVGFTSGTGAGSGDNKILSWQYENGPISNEVPEPTSIALFALGLAGLIGTRKKRAKL